VTVLIKPYPAEATSKAEFAKLIATYFDGLDRQTVKDRLRTTIRNVERSSITFTQAFERFRVEDPAYSYLSEYPREAIKRFTSWVRDYRAIDPYDVNLYYVHLWSFTQVFGDEVHRRIKPSAHYKWRGFEWFHFFGHTVFGLSWTQAFSKFFEAIYRAIAQTTVRFLEEYERNIGAGMSYLLGPDMLHHDLFKRALAIEIQEYGSPVQYLRYCAGLLDREMQSFSQRAVSVARLRQMLLAQGRLDLADNVGKLAAKGDYAAIEELLKAEGLC